MRAFLVTLAGMIVGGFTLRQAAQLWNPDADLAPAILAIGIACMVGAALPLFGGLRAQKTAFGIGLALGLLLLLLK